MNHEFAKEAEVIAKRMVKEQGQPEGLFELFLPQAYQELIEQKLIEKEKK